MSRHTTTGYGDYLWSAGPMFSAVGLFLCELYELGEEEWKLLTLRDPSELKDYSEAAWRNYYKILTHTLAFLRENGSLIWSRGNKYNKIIKLIYRKYMQDLAAQHTVKIKKVRESQERRNSETLNSGLKTIFLSLNLNELVDRNKLLLASRNAGRKFRSI